MNMEIKEYFSSENKAHWLEELKKCEWSAGKFLAELLENGSLQDTVGTGALVPMLTDGDKLSAFCTFAPLDDIQPTALTPWIGFVYTFPEYRGHRYAGMLLDWCESVAAVMGRERIYISTYHTGLYEKYGYEFMTVMPDVNGEDSRVYSKALLTGEDKDARLERGAKHKADIVAAAKKDTDMQAICGFSCSHCFLSDRCGGCRSFFNCCSYGTLHEKCVCPNLSCCKEKGLDGCYDCPELMVCQKGFYSLGDASSAAKAQALFVRKYGKEAFERVQDKLHKKYDFQKTQEILGADVGEGLRILEENM